MVSVHLKGPRAPIRLVKWVLNGDGSAELLTFSCMLAEPLIRTYTHLSEHHLQHVFWLKFDCKNNKIKSDSQTGETHLSFVEKNFVFSRRLLYNALVLCMTSERDMKQHYPLILWLAFYSRMGF